VPCNITVIQILRFFFLATPRYTYWHYELNTFHAEKKNCSSEKELDRTYDVVWSGLTSLREEVQNRRYCIGPVKAMWGGTQNYIALLKGQDK
jgi:hypothetical protein